MATIRSYTTIEQSRKLAEILPLESAEKGKKYLVEVLGRRTTLDGTKLWEE